MRNKEVYKNCLRIEQFLFLVAVFTFCFIFYTTVEGNTKTEEKSIKVHNYSNTSNILVISCVDFRFVSFIHTFLTDNLKLKSDYDHIAIPESIINSLQKETQKVTFNEVDISLNLHHVKRLIFIGQKDCGEYGSERFEFVGEETRMFPSDLRRVQDMLKEKHPRLEIDLFLASMKTVGCERIFYIEPVK